MDLDELAATLRAAGCVFAEEEAALLLREAPDEDALTAMVARRVAGEQVQLFEEDGGWQVPEGMRAADVLDLYRDEAARADALVEEHALEDGPAWWPEEIFPGLPVRDVRRLVLAVITETATHAGHLDAVRELIDGRTWLVLT
jgi:hypothetical protein